MTEANSSVSPAATLPRTGMVATVRNRRGVIGGVRPFDGPQGVLHVVDIDYNDGGSPLQETLLWEREAFARLLPPAALPEPQASTPMSEEDLTALVRACRWSARTPYIDPDADGPLDRLPVSAPFHGAVQVEDFQLVPLLKALRMPRVSLLIADDVGLGKTIEAGLILSELLLRRRIRRVLILTPAALRLQWRDELWTKFALAFNVVDADATVKLRRQIGLDANPWRSHARIIASYHYLKQPDVLEEFRAAGRADPNEAPLPWDLLIVDEAHNLTPPPLGDESDLCKMLRHISPLFEHRVFLTATPHNGHTRSFTGLLEMLDPVRFSQTHELKSVERARIQDVLVRRLKREINARSATKKFCDRLPPQALTIALRRKEKALSAAFEKFREKLHTLIRTQSRRRRIAGNFAVEILGKRMLSCSAAFAESWRRCRAGMAEPDEVTDAEVLAAQKSLEDETVDDREAESRRGAASSVVGAWLRPFAGDLADVSSALDQAIEELGFRSASDPAAQDPDEDARFAALKSLIESKLRAGGEWRADERLVVFTEYKTTLDYLLRRLREEFEPHRILCLFGGMDDPQREQIKRAFNDPDNPVRVLVATDAASEGLNLQETARYLLHFDIPWNPARLEQRNGRLDRHGQARDVSTWHFVSQDDRDLAFLDYVVRKVDAIREDLGATGDVFDEALQRRLIAGEDNAEVLRDLDRRLVEAAKLVDIPRDDRAVPAIRPEEKDPAGDLKAIAAELDLDPESMRVTLDAAMAVGAGRPRISNPDDHGISRILQPHPPAWGPILDDYVRLPAGNAAAGALPGLAFDPNAFIVTIGGGLPVFRPRPDALLMHLAHPLIHHALTALTRLRFPGASDRVVSRWTARRSEIPSGAEAVIALHVEELAVNELRETFHHWVRTLRLPVRKGKLGAPLSHSPAMDLRTPPAPLDAAASREAGDLWLDIEPDVRDFLKRFSAELTATVKSQIEFDRKKALKDEQDRYQSRQGEISALIESNTVARLAREIEDLKRKREQGVLFDQERRLDELDRDLELREEELRRRRVHYEELRAELAKERDRILKNLIPKRFALRSDVQIMPIAVEIILPASARPVTRAAAGGRKKSR